MIILIGVGVQSPDTGPLNDLMEDDAQGVNVPSLGEHPGRCHIPQILWSSPQLALVVLITLPENELILTTLTSVTLITCLVPDYS